MTPFDVPGFNATAYGTHFEARKPAEARKPDELRRLAAQSREISRMLADASDLAAHLTDQLEALADDLSEEFVGSLSEELV